MRQSFEGWDAVARQLMERANACVTTTSPGSSKSYLNDGQRASMKALAERLPNNGVVLADEVGMGKTRIAVALARAVIEAGGRVAILVPPGLGYQWQAELANGSVEAPEILRGLWSYFDAWKQNPEIPTQELRPWFAHNVVLLSHAFANWRLGENSDRWRWAMLPHFYAQWRTVRGGRLPRGYRTWVSEDCDASCLLVYRAAQHVAAAISQAPQSPTNRLADRLLDELSWPAPLDAGKYVQWAGLREWLERVVGLGLGVFDLIIIDEAHKSRGSESGLSRLLERMVVPADHGRRLAMTATPVELDVWQWSSTLTRIGLADDHLQALSPSITGYADAIKRVRRAWLVSDEAISEFKSRAREFESALSPYLLRRDKREDPAVQKFHLQRPADEYRNLSREVRVSTTDLSLPWKRAVCASEALSLTTDGSSDPATKRLRLTLGNGHGIAAVIDHMQHNADDDHQISDDDRQELSIDEATGGSATSAELKRQHRTQWWLNILQRSFVNGDETLFEHPAILAAVEAIEEEIGKGEKVLVFGRFTRPLRALVQLLNAREMLRRLEGGQPWPQSKVAVPADGSIDSNEWPAVRAAYRQLRSLVTGSTLDEPRLDKILEEQYNKLHDARSRFRDKLLDTLERGLSEKYLNGEYKNSVQIRAVVDALRRANAPADIALIARALSNLVRHREDQASDLPDPRAVVRALDDLINSSLDEDDPDIDENEDESGAGSDEREQRRREEHDAFWTRLKDRLKEEFGRPEGRFARLMYGGTSHASRRLIQLGFNRGNAYPQVLAAQSLVGREGLNLHEACRVVVILHPEWNPGVVEQQIGRVDRVGSRWCNELEESIIASVPSEDLPRIEVRLVIFEGTYDEYNWRVLRQRWDDLRAQLHGIVIPPRIATQRSERARQINQFAPSFSPSSAQ